MTDQPPPQPNDLPAVWDLVIADMRARNALGRERYGVPLQPHNGRDALLDKYQEQLDDIAYTKQHILEMRELGENLRLLRDLITDRCAHSTLLRLIDRILRENPVLAADTTKED